MDHDMVDQYGDIVEEREPTELVAGRVVGIAVFLAGVVMLVLAFLIAFQAFGNPDMIVPRAELARDPAPRPAEIYVPVMLKLVLLFAMGYLGSQIASRGAQLFFSARRERRSAGD